MMFEQYVVTADYQKKNKNDISLKAGDIIDVIERNDYGENKKNIIDCLCDLKDQSVLFAEPLEKMSLNSGSSFPSEFSVVSQGLVYFLATTMRKYTDHAL